MIMHALLMTYSSALRHLTRARQETTCESVLKDHVGVYVFLFLSRAVDSLATEIENCKRILKKKAQAMHSLVVLCLNCY